MSSDPARTRRWRERKAKCAEGDHSLCGPRTKCPVIGKAQVSAPSDAPGDVTADVTPPSKNRVTPAPPPPGLGERGTRLWAEWAGHGFGPGHLVLLEEACRTADTLERLNVHGSPPTRPQWLELVPERGRVRRESVVELRVVVNGAAGRAAPAAGRCSGSRSPSCGTGCANRAAGSGPAAGCERRAGGVGSGAEPAPVRRPRARGASVTSSTPRGASRPRVEGHPEYAYTLGDVAIELARPCGTDPRSVAGGRGPADDGLPRGRQVGVRRIRGVGPAAVRQGRAARGPRAGRVPAARRAADHVVGARVQDGEPGVPADAQADPQARPAGEGRRRLAVGHHDPSGRERSGSRSPAGTTTRASSGSTPRRRSSSSPAARTPAAGSTVT